MSAPRKIVIAIVALLTGVLLYPFKIIVVPEQRALVVTNAMHPVRNSWVRQTWYNYSLERTWHEEDLPTDCNGRVTFPTRTIRASLLRRMLGPLASIAGQGVHASFGVRSDMFPLPKGGTISSAVVQPQRGEIVFRVEL